MRMGVEIYANMRQFKAQRAAFSRVSAPPLPSSLLPSSADKTRKLQRINFTAYISSKSNSYSYVWVYCHKCWPFFSTLSHKTSQLAASLLPCTKYDFSFYLTNCQSRQFAKLSMPVCQCCKGYFDVNLITTCSAIDLVCKNYVFICNLNLLLIINVKNSLENLLEKSVFNC